MESLVESLRARGQQTPIEVVELAPGRYGLISGWRRITALKRLLDETGDARFAAALAILRRPEDASESYVAMVEENEIRVGLSYYERARIVVRAVEEGVYPTQKAALQSLFASASRAKRSKIKSFIVLVEALDADLAFPTQIGERLGLDLSRRLAEDPPFAEQAIAVLRDAAPEQAEAELALLAGLVSRRLGPPQHAEVPGDDEIAPGVFLRTARGQAVLTGPDIDAAFLSALRKWVSSTG